jgi:hypothetical protein
MDILCEADIVELLVFNIPQVFGEHADHAVEVGTHGRAKTDLCVLVGDKLIAIEAKYSNRRRAIGQAYLNRYYADHSYIAVLGSHITGQLAADARRWRLGILSVSQAGVSVAIPAPAAFPDLNLRARVIGTAFS